MKRKENEIIFTAPRKLEADLDRIPFPARDLFPNDKYICYHRRNFGHATTSIITTRGCPFSCESCSRPVFGNSYRERSPKNVVDEVEQALSFGYNRIHFADDVFTLNKEHVVRICEEIKNRGIHFKWECLGRVDLTNSDTLKTMKDVGCDRIFFGIESGNDSILKLMKKGFTIDSARKAVDAANSAGLNTGAFFILCYPGETDDTVLNTIRFATSLPLDYLSFSIPHILLGAPLYEKVKGRVTKEQEAWHSLISEGFLLFDANFSKAKMKFAVLKGNAQFWMRKKWGKLCVFAMKPFEILTEAIFRLMK